MILLYILIFLIIVVLVTAALLPKDFRIETSITIQTSKETAFDYVKLIKNQEHYSVWVMKDPNVKLSYTGTDGTVGFVAARESTDKNVGIGSQEITNIIDDVGYEVVLRFEKPMKATNYASTTVSSNDDTSCVVTNSFWWRSPRPFNLMNAMFIPKLRKDMHQNLVNLKEILEK